MALLSAALLSVACSDTVDDYLSGDYVEWEGNARGDYVLDALGREFRVLAESGTVVSVDRDLVLRDLEVDDDAVVVDHGTAIGTVKLIPYSNATYVAAFICRNGNRMRIDTERSTYPTGTWQIRNC